MTPLSIKTIDEGRAKFREHKAALLAKGVVLPYQMQRYLTDGEKANGVLAFDAASGLPGPLSTDPNAALPWMLTSAIDPEIIRVIFSPLEFADILGERKAGVWTQVAYLKASNTSAWAHFGVSVAVSLVPRMVPVPVHEPFAWHVMQILPTMLPDWIPNTRHI